MTVRRLEAFPVDSERRDASVDRRLASLLSSASRSASCFARPIGHGVQGLDLGLRRLDLVLRVLDVGIDGRLDVGLATLDRGRGRDELLGKRVRDGGGLRGIRVLGGDRQERAVERRIGPDALSQVVRGAPEAELLDGRVQDGTLRRDRRVRRRQALRNQELVDVRVCHLEGLADDQCRLGLVGLRQQAAQDERDAARQEHGDDEQRQPWPDDRDLSPKVHGDLTLVASGPGRSTSGSAAAGDPKA